MCTPTRMESATRGGSEADGADVGLEVTGPHATRMSARTADAHARSRSGYIVATPLGQHAPYGPSPCHGRPTQDNPIVGTKFRTRPAIVRDVAPPEDPLAGEPFSF